MAKKKDLASSKDTEDVLKVVTSHYNEWTQDNDTRRTRKNGWNDITDSYWGKLPDNWPYISKVVDPVIRTTLIEKNGRLVNSKLRGRLVPRKGSTVLSANINNALLDFQWDQATFGGSMTEKISICDLDTRLYASKFVLTIWRCEYDDEGEIVKEGNDIVPLDIRDCGMDSSAQHIRGAKWFQHRSWPYLDDLLDSNKSNPNEPQYKNIDVIAKTILEKSPRASSRRDKAYVSRVKQLKGLQDRVGTDIAFPVVELVTEYRKDRWITFAPEYGVILRDVKNPFKHGKIPVSQNRYYAIQDDPLGESEIEPVLPLWRAIQANLCGFMDEVILKMRPPLKIIENAARIETIVYGPEAQWLVDRPDAVTEMQSNGEATRYFQTTHSALRSAFSNAMGDISQSVSQVDPFNGKDKTATEIRSSERQQNSRDQKNQVHLAEFIEDFTSMWLVNNRQFLFSDPKKYEYLIKIVGKEQFDYFKRAGLDQTVLPKESAQLLADIIYQQGGDLEDSEISQLVEAAKVPKYPVPSDPNETDPEKMIFKPKMSVSEHGDEASLYLTPEDLDGEFDFVADVKSMAAGASDELRVARQNAIQTLTGNPVVLQLLQQDGYRPKIKEIITSSFEDLGLRDADRFFEQISTNPGAASMGGVPPSVPDGGFQGSNPTVSGVQTPQPMAQPVFSQGQGGVPQAI